jgi:signal transduction histidine kinase
MTGARDVARAVDDRVIRAAAEVNAAVRDGLDEDTVLGLVARRVGAMLGAPACLVMTVEDDETLVVRAAAGPLAEATRGMRIPTVDTFEGEVVRHQRSIRLPDVGGDGDAASVLPPMVRAVLAVPVPGYGRPSGVIEVGDVHGRRFTADDADLVGLFAAHVAVVVEHERAGADLEPLADSSPPGAEPLPVTLDSLTSSVVATMGASACAVDLLHGDALRRASGHDVHRVLDRELLADVHDAARQAVSAKSPVIRRRGRDGSLVQAEPDGRAGEVPTEAPGGALVCVPLTSRGGAVGVLYAAWPPGPGPTELELAYLSAVAGEAATAVDSSHLVAAAQEKATQEERQRLARELHDSVSQALYGIALGARTARQTLRRAPEQADQSLTYILSLAETGLADMRALIFELRPQALAEEGLVVALHKQLAALRARHGLVTEAELGSEPAGTLAVKQTLYRVAQEALQNVARHARARRVTVRLSASSTALELEISDDGSGFDPRAEFPGHLGLRSMRERVSEIGGVLNLTSEPGKGTTVRVRVPSGLWP